MQEPWLPCLLLQNKSSSGFTAARSNTCIHGHVQPWHPSPSQAASSEHLLGTEIICLLGFFPQKSSFFMQQSHVVQSMAARLRDGKDATVTRMARSCGSAHFLQWLWGKKRRKQEKKLPGLLGGLPPPTTSALHVLGLVLKPPRLRAGGGFVGAELGALGRCCHAGILHPARSSMGSTMLCLAGAGMRLRMLCPAGSGMGSRMLCTAGPHPGSPA